MGNWFVAGGYGMVVTLALGLGSLVVGALAARRPAPGKLAALRSLPGLIMLSAVFAFGTNLWAVNVHLTDNAFVTARSISGDQLPFVALLGFTEAAQTLTLGGLLAMLVVALRIMAESRAAKANGA